MRPKSKITISIHIQISQSIRQDYIFFPKSELILPLFVATLISVYEQTQVNEERKKRKRTAMKEERREEREVTMLEERIKEGEKDEP